MIGLMCAVSLNGIIGNSKNEIPWCYPEDMKHFRKMTENSTIIMGKNTYYSIGKPLPKRRNIVITSSQINGIETFSTIDAALKSCQTPSPAQFIVDNCGTNIINKTTEKNIWLIGGESIFRNGMKYADSIHLTIVPLIIEERNAIKFPWINPDAFKCEGIFPLAEDSELKHAVYRRTNLVLR